MQAREGMTTITPHLLQLKCPPALVDLPGWLIWRFEHQPGGSKPRKVPYYAGGGRRQGVQGRPEDRERLVTFEAAKAAAARRGFDGVGFAPMPEWKVSALDFDNCVKGGRVDPEVENLIGHTYAEFSPSGNGVRAFIRGTLGNHKSPAGESFGFETFSSKGFVTFTGNTLAVCEQFDTASIVGESTDGIRALVQERFGREREAEEGGTATPLGVPHELIEQALDVLDPDMAHEQWLRVGMAIHHETGGSGFELWDNWSARGSKYPSSEALEQRWESFGRNTGRSTTIRSLIQLANQHGAHISLTPALDAAAFDNLSPAAPAAPAATLALDEDGKPLRYQFIPAEEFMEAEELDYVIDGVVPRSPLTVLFGESGSGKSFVALDMACAIARGAPWREHETTQGRVAYVAAEGAVGMRKRIRAYCEFHGLERVDVRVLADSPNLMVVQDVKDLVRGVRAVGPVSLIVIDTFAQTTPGANENSGEDMGKALGHCRQLSKHTGGTPILLVHHAGKDTSKGARGWSGIRAAADAELEVIREGDQRSVKLTKAKDDIDGTEWPFRLNVVNLGLTAKGKKLDSCVVLPAEQGPVRTQAGNGGRVGMVQRLVRRVLLDMVQLGTGDVQYDDLVAGAVAQLPHENGQRDQRTARVKRAIGLLQADGQLAIDNMRVRPA